MLTHAMSLRLEGSMNKNKISIAVRFPQPDEFAEEASGRTGQPFPKEIVIMISDETQAALNSQDTFVANRAFDSLDDLIQEELNALGFGGIPFDFG